MDGPEAMKQLIANLDGLAMQTLLIEADVQAGKTLPPADLASFLAGVRNITQTTATMFRAIANAIAAHEKGT